MSLPISCSNIDMFICKMHLFTCLVALIIVQEVTCYKPVIFMHGVLSNGRKSKSIFQWISELHPNTVTIAIEMFDDKASIINLNTQVEKIGARLTGVMKKYPDGIHLICYSQGGQVCRGLLERFEHNVHTFVALGAPLSGQYGMTDNIAKLFPGGWLAKSLYKIAYTKRGQKISVANYWNDPLHQDLYRKGSEYLALLNNDRVHNRSKEYKDNFTRLKKMVMIGGPDDGVIQPWQSSHFGFFDEDMTVRNMTETKWFQDDTFGLQTLYKRDDIVTCTFPGVNHTDWHSTKLAFDKCMLPYLI